MWCDEGDRVRVLQVFGSLGLGGAESRMMDIYRATRGGRVDFDFIDTHGEDEYFAPEIVSLGGRIFRAPDPAGLGVWAHLVWLVRVLRAGDYHAVHAHTSYHGGVVAFAGFLAGTPVRIVHARTSGSSRGRSLKTRASVAVGRLLIAAFATHRLALSSSAAQFVFGRRESRVKLLPNPFVLEPYLSPQCDLQAEFRREYGLENAPLVVGQVGRFHAVKNHRFSMQVFGELRREVPEARLVLVGDGALRRESELEASALGIQDGVVFVGVSEDVAEWLSIFDVVVHPSHFEGFGGAVLEAQAAGVPCVVSEGLPAAVDVGLGLVTFLSLAAGAARWKEVILSRRGALRPSVEARADAFERRGLSVATVARELLGIYEGGR